MTERWSWTDDVPAAEAPQRQLTDLGNAELLIDMHGADLRWVPAWNRWLVWDGVRWRHDLDGAIHRRAHDVARALYVAAAEAPTEAEAKRIGSWAQRSQGFGRLKAMVDIARALDGVPVGVEDLDADPWLLNVRNGTVDLHTGQLRGHDRRDLITKLCPISYDPEAQAPTWHKFLDRIFGGDVDVIEFLQRAVGYSITGSTREQVVFLPHGSGSNGKSRFLEAVRFVLGDYGQAAPSDLLVGRRDGAATNDVARLPGKRFVAAVETGEDRWLNETLVKQLTGGDTMAARFLYAEYFEFTPVCKLWLATNHKPRVRGADHAIWRRLRLVPFLVQIPDSEQDKDLGGKLNAEAAGILAWAVRGCLRWQEVGLDAPAAVTEATAGYRADSDLVGAFLAERCDLDPAGDEGLRELYTQFKAWCDDTGEKPRTNRWFDQALTERALDSYQDPRTRRKRYVGVRLAAVP